MTKEEFVEKYSFEIRSIDHDLEILKSSHIYEIDKAPGVPRASTVALRLEKKIADLLDKIANEAPTSTDKIIRLSEKKGFKNL